MPSSLEPGHPCFFAREFAEDPFVKNGIELYSKVAQDKDRFTMEGNYTKAWEAVLHLRAIHSELTEHCEKLKKEKIDRERPTGKAG